MDPLQVCESYFDILIFLKINMQFANNSFMSCQATSSLYPVKNLEILFSHIYQPYHLMLTF